MMLHNMFMGIGGISLRQLRPQHPLRRAINEKEIRIESAGIKDDGTGTIDIEETYDDRTQSQKDLSSIENASNLDVDLRKGDTETELGESHIASALRNDDDTDQIITEELHDDQSRIQRRLHSMNS